MAKLLSTCKHCGKEFEHWKCKNRKFCSKQCADKFNHPTIRIRLNEFCRYCKNLLTIHQKNNIYCSYKCFLKMRNKPPESFDVVITEQQMKRWHKSFEKHVIKKEGCWDWMGSKNKKGYSKMSYDMFAHRFSYMYHKGPIPKGMLVCHHCDFPSCSRPEHLFLGTNKDNMQDMVKKGRTYKRTKRSVNAKLTDQQVLDIKKLLKEGISHRKIGKKFNVSDYSIFQIQLNKTYKNVQETE